MVPNLPNKPRKLAADMIIKQFAQELFQRRDPYAVFWQQVPRRSVEESLLLDMPLVKCHAILNLLRRPILNCEPSVVQSFNRILSDFEDLASLRQVYLRWKGALTPGSSPSWRASHFVTIPTVRAPGGSAALAIRKTTWLAKLLRASRTALDILSDYFLVEIAGRHTK